MSAQLLEVPEIPNSLDDWFSQREGVETYLDEAAKLRDNPTANMMLAVLHYHMDGIPEPYAGRTSSSSRIYRATYRKLAKAAFDKGDFEQGFRYASVADDRWGPAHRLGVLGAVRFLGRSAFERFYDRLNRKVTGVNENISRLALEEGEFEQAERYAQKCVKGIWKLRAYLRLSRAAAAAGNLDFVREQMDWLAHRASEERKELFGDEAKALVCALTDTGEEQLAIDFLVESGEDDQAIYKYHLAIGRLDEAQPYAARLARQPIPYRFLHTSELSQFILAYGLENSLTADPFGVGVQQDTKNGALALAFVESGMPEEAAKYAKKIQDDRSRRQCFGDLGISSARNGTLLQTIDFFDASGGEYGPYVLEALLGAGKNHQAEIFLDVRYGGCMRRSVAVAHALSRCYDNAEQLIARVKGPRQRFLGFCDLAKVKLGLIGSFRDVRSNYDEPQLPKHLY